MKLACPQEQSLQTIKNVWRKNQFPRFSQFYLRQRFGSVALNAITFLYCKEAVNKQVKIEEKTFHVS
jgi:hypothetical protein